MGGAVAAPVAVTKLLSPTVGAHCMSRPGLMARVGVAPVTVVVAPAGWGKSTLLGQWAQSLGGESRRVFVRLDGLDDDPVRFWQVLTEALRTAGFLVRARVPTSAQLGSSGLWESLAAAVLNDLAAAAEPVTVVVDDYQHVSAEPVHVGVRYLLSRLPSGVRVVLASRQEPPLGLARLRAAGRLEEIRATDLALTAEQTTGVVAAVAGAAVSDGDMRGLHQSTEGWAAGVFLAALSLRGADDPTGLVHQFGADHRHIADFLIAEVLAGVGEPLQEFLLRCSVLEELLPELCAAVAERPDADRRLREAEDRGLFVQAVGPSRQAYRLHPLFAGVLRDRLAERDPGALAVLRARAAGWFAEHGMAGEAVEQALAAGDHDRAADLLTPALATLLGQGRIATVGRWLASLPDVVMRRRPALAVAAATASATAGDVQRAEKLLTWAEDALDAGVPVDMVGEPRAEIAATLALCRLMRRELLDAERLARRAAQTERDAAGSLSGNGHVVWATALFWLGRCDEARDAVDDVFDCLDPPLVRMLGAGVLSAACLETGQLDRCVAVARDALQVAEQREVGPSAELTLSYLALGGALTLMDDVKGAEAALAQGVGLAGLWAAPPQQAYGQLLQARLRLVQGRTAEAAALVDAARPVVRSARVRGLLASTLDRVDRDTRPSRLRRQNGGVALTGRERELIRLLQSHLSQPEIAARMGVSLNTVKSYRRGLYAKLGATCRSEAVATARQLNLI